MTNFQKKILVLQKEILKFGKEREKLKGFGWNF